MREKYFSTPRANVYDRSPLQFRYGSPLLLRLLFSLPAFTHSYVAGFRIVIPYTQYSYINIQPQLSKFTHPQNSPEEIFLPPLLRRTER